MAKMSAIDWIAMILVIIGALNWGLVGIFGLDLVAKIFGGIPVLAKLIYVLVGIAGLYLIYFVAKK